MIGGLLTYLLILVGLLIFYVKWNFDYWTRRGIFHHRPSFPLGNAKPLFMQQKSFNKMYNEVYAEAKAKKLQHAGFFFMLFAQYIPVDLEIVKCILQKDFQYFVDRGVYYNERDDPIGAHLFTMEGSKWKTLRAKLSPTFTSGRIKTMFPIVVEVTQQLTSIVQTSNRTGVEIKDLLARLTTDIIGTCAFGIDCNSLENPDAEFREMGRAIFELTAWQNIVQLFTFVFPTVAKFLKVKQQRKDVSDFFMGVIKQTVEYREKNSIKRNDFMDLLIQLKNSGKLDDEDIVDNLDGKALTIEEIAGQAFVFFIGGFETSSTTMSFCLYELSLNQNVQEKLREEVDRVMDTYEGNLTYDALFDMQYMDMVINETLRKYPPLPVLNRICTQNYNVPNTDLVLEKNTKIIIPVQGIHYDEEYYPDPETFDPERFTEENKKKRNPLTFLPFGEGPRICIGLRFGILQTKVGLALLLRNFKFNLNPQTPVPLVIDHTKFLNTAIGGIFLDIDVVDK